MRRSLLLFPLICALLALGLVTASPAQSATTFTPLLKGFQWSLSTTGANGATLPAGETESGVTIGIRSDGDSAHSPGTYQYLVVVAAGQTSETPAQITTALGKALPPGNYWAAIDQTDMFNSAPATSAWTGEIPFSIPPPIVTPAPPAGFTAD